MKILWLCIFLCRTVYSNANYEYNDENLIVFTNTDHNTSCEQNSQTIHCNTTLTAGNYNEFAAELSKKLRRHHTQRMELQCVSCALDTFPNEILNYGRWSDLNFASSHIVHLQMSNLRATVAGNLIRLNFNNNSITHLDEQSFPDADSIQDVDLSYNLINSVTGGWIFQKMRDLRTLNLAHNHITQLDPFVFQELRSLDTLHINNNRLWDTSFIGNLNKFLTLTLSYNPIVNLAGNIEVNEFYLQNSSISNCSVGGNVEKLLITDGMLQTIDLLDASSLRYANLSSNQLTHFDIKDNGSLQVLELYDNKIQMINLLRSTRLWSLSLAKNNVTSTFNLLLPDSLEYLDLSHNKITNLAHETFKNLWKLDDLKLAHCELHALNAAVLKPTAMRQLDLSYNRFVTLDMIQFNELNELKDLNLNGNQLTDINVEDLSESTKLGISNNDWNCKRLRVIVDIVNFRNANIYYEPCDQFACGDHVDGITCHSEDLTTEPCTNNAERLDDYTFYIFIVLCIIGILFLGAGVAVFVIRRSFSEYTCEEYSYTPSSTVQH